MIYITGMSGFVGQHLAARLGKSKVIGIPHDKLSTFKLKDPTEVYFLSTYGNLFSHTDTDKIIKANTLDLINIVRQVVGTNIKSFVFFSTSSVKLPTQTTYSRSKRSAEEILLAYMEKYKLPICIVRPFSITGVGEHKEHLIPTLIKSCLTGKLVNFVPGPSHDYIDIADVIEGVMALSSRGVRGIFELGTGRSYTNQEVLDIVEEETGKKANINIVNQMRNYDYDNWVSNNYKARGYGWLPKVELRTSIRNIIAYDFI